MPTCISLEFLLLFTRRYIQRQGTIPFSPSGSHINLCIAMGDALRCYDMLTLNRLRRRCTAAFGACAASRISLQHFRSMYHKINCLPWCLLRNPSSMLPHRSARVYAQFSGTHQTAVDTRQHNHRSTVVLPTFCCRIAMRTVAGCFTSETHD